MIKMFYINDACEVTVYQFFEDKTALIFSPISASRQKGKGGWLKVSVKNLLPLDFYSEYFNRKGFMSKTEKNKIKERLTLTQAVWTCSDGTSFTNCDEAIEYEKIIMNDVL